ncbi:MAG: carbamoyltransferase HypF [Alphaproteobacteria bacterium]|nr:carbamoyltransferase HypF [Alphaproteobacteria bacterium]
MNRRIRVDIRGIVQGVGYRPFVYRVASRMGLSGFVTNTPTGVSLEAEGPAKMLDQLLGALKSSGPLHAVVEALTVEPMEILGGGRFAIRESAMQGARLARIVPDLATCDDCLRELFDPSDRRHLYPFINCTQCGPRYSIIEDLPYDRSRTSMRRFAMCPACAAEYADPLNRRFHAEPNACPVCGPRVVLCNARGAEEARDQTAIVRAADAIRDGRIVAAKGIGGFHLLADARNEAAVALLRARKHRPDKPFAVLFPALADVQAACAVSPQERDLLASPAHPIVLVRRDRDGIAQAVAPGNPWLGAFLPYAPLHHLLLRELGFPVVATSGNVSDEPIVIDESEALARLGAIADAFLVHDRPIVRPVDDSVARILSGEPQVLRCARGYAPVSIALSGAKPGILALGGHLKTTIAATLEDAVLVSQHVGDLDTPGARATHERLADDLLRLRGIEPRTVAHDLHPDYATTRMAPERAGETVAVQHHLAHVVACMAENGVQPPVLGVAWDGTGYGTDGTIWGGEFLVVENDCWRRLGHLRPFRLPGGEMAAREPRRAALGLLYQAFGDRTFEMENLAPLAEFTPRERDVLRAMLRDPTNAPLTSSMGRLFDAFASLCGVRQRSTYEGQAAAEFEWAASDQAMIEPYPFPLLDGEVLLDWQPALERLLSDLRSGVTLGAISRAVHAGLATSIAAAARQACVDQVVLTGGCFQNASLTEMAIHALREAGHRPLWHRRVPPNDGSIALGQAVWASRRIRT